MRNFKAEAQSLFDAQTMAELADILGITGDTAIAAFQIGLIDLCAHYREVISTLPCDLPDAPFNLSLTKRADWLDVNVINPCERVQAAIGEDMRPMFSTWPYPLSIPVFRDNTTMARELADLLQQATKLRDQLRGQQSDDAGHSQELRAEVFASVARLLREHCPSVNPNRGVYDPELRRRVGVYVDAFRLIFRKITGVEENLDRLICGEISLPS
ncbi:hypothetical protein U8326_10595 [Tsuneonella sp. CC-YZS046]|uniref:hypothetical protein n=1 Tax=Tsuneonella sp. CC-YZS046 TaxID=3042152 RepID=UPI002D7984F0|nr:hypothetical protein [Tsuneonella sp. CC-YZS046]WRO65505.1 hypothetical protein U8326_10595 [Tsuneonella sp. CC-YZS046]